MRILLAIAACALLLIGIWWGISSSGQSGTSASVDQAARTRPVSAPRQKAPRQTAPAEPRLGTSLADSYPPLSERAQAGDAEAAIRLFDDLSECLHLSRLDAAFKAEVKDKNSFLNKPDSSESDAKERSKDLDVIQKELDEIQRADALCRNLPDDFNDGRIYEVALQAARAGDAYATACLLVAPWKAPDPTPGQGREYAREVMQLAADGLHQGSWNVASAMPLIYSPGRFVEGPPGGYSGFLIRHDPVKELQYSELLRLGTPDGTPEAAHLDRGLSMLRGTLSPAQKAAADHWAQKTFARYFLHSGFVNPETSPCNY